MQTGREGQIATENPEDSRLLQNGREDAANGHSGREAAASDPEMGPGVRSVWERVEAFLENLTPEEVERLPEDGAEAHDHYLYGVPRSR